MAYLIVAIVMTLSILEGHSLLPAFSSAIFCIYGTLRGPSASAELLVVTDCHIICEVFQSFEV